MPGRIGRALESAGREHRGAFIPFLTSGFPDSAESDRLALALCEEGADVLELGVPFSDPLADGPVIQRTTEAALRAGTTVAHVLGQTLRIRARHETAIVLMSYLNPILRHGAEVFARDAVDAGVDGVLIVDLPPEEEPAIWDSFRAAGLDTIAMVSPTTDPARLPVIEQRARGYLYVVARLGVTGAGSADPAIATALRALRARTPLARCLGFGFGLGSDLSPYRGEAEGIIVGSALLAAILEGRDAADREARARAFARTFRGRLEGWTAA
jgi:tryptophan synthase alpha chain